MESDRTAEKRVPAALSREEHLRLRTFKLSAPRSPPLLILLSHPHHRRTTNGETTPNMASGSTSTPTADNPIVYLDISFGDQPAPSRAGANRIVLELYKHLVPKTAANFQQLCTGAAGKSSSGVELKFAGSTFHRVIPKFMIQGGDFTRGDGTGGESIYGEKFEDEDLTGKHDAPFLLSMANAGPNTNGSQFFITTVPTPHLDGKHVVFGRVLKGKSVVRRIENTPTQNDRPVEEVKIAQCGELDPESSEVKEGSYGIGRDESGDAFEEYPEDEGGELETSVEKTLEVATQLKTIANVRFAKGDHAVALEKYLKAMRYLQLHPVLPDDTPEPTRTAWYTLKTSVQLNASLAALKSTPPQPRVAISQATAVVQFLNSAQATSWDPTPEADAKRKADLAKAFYRRALAYGVSKDDDRADADLKRAADLAPTDPGIKKEQSALAKRREAKVKAQRAAYSKMFA